MAIGAATGPPARGFPPTLRDVFKLRDENSSSSSSALCRAAWVREGASAAGLSSKSSRFEVVAGFADDDVGVSSSSNVTLPVCANASCDHVFANPDETTPPFPPQACAKEHRSL